MIIKKFEAFSGSPEGGETQHQQTDSDLPRDPQISVRGIDTGENSSVLHIKDLEVDDVILFRGTKYKVIEDSEFAIKAKNVRIDKTILINQKQLSQYGIFVIK
jgi:hypothetical protein